MESTEADVVIVGAGVAGLACARDLRVSGRSVIVLEKSRGVGGRCATRRVEGQPVDHGPAFLHGADREFLGTVLELPSGERIDGWPARTRGEGRPCLPRAFSRGERCVALRGGMTVLPKRLARDLDVRPNVEIRSIGRAGGFVEAVDAEGRAFRAPVAVLTPPAPQTSDLLNSLDPGSRETDAIRSVLGMITSISCLTVLAGYPADVPLPEWQMLYPEDSRLLHVVSLDSDKRAEPAFTVLVLQGLPGWSRVRLDTDPARWAAEALAEAQRLIGPWAGDPLWVQTHRWRYARAGTGSELTRPMIAALEDGARIGLAGEIFSPGGGVQGAWRSGRRLAARLISEDPS
jgi:predicted NAD/FAD-dependent oxidoreductase